MINNIFFFAEMIIYDFKLNNILIGPLPIMQCLIDSKDTLINIIITIYPLKISGSSHIPLPPSICLEDFRYFISDENCFLIFYNFLLKIEKDFTLKQNFPAYYKHG